MVTVGPANISAESHRIVDVTDPSGPQDAATKKYVDDQIDGLASVASSGQYSDLTGTPVLALVATSGSFTDLSNAPDVVDFVCDSVFANNSLHTSGSIEGEYLSVKQNMSVGLLSVGSLSRLEILDNLASGVAIHQVKNNLLDINSQGTLALSSTGDLSIQGLVYPSADGTAGQIIVTDGAGTLSFATPFSGAYADLTGAPTIPADVSELTDTTNLLFDGAYSNLTGAPTIPADVSELTDTTNLLFDGAYSNLTGAPTLATVATSGAYSDLTGAPTIPADVSDLTDTTNLLFDGAYSNLTGAPTIPADVSDLTDTTNLLFSGAYADLTGIPRLPVYTNDTARDTAIPTPTIGMIVISASTLQWYNGTVWGAL
jgi:hypothetical protein